MSMYTYKKQKRTESLKRQLSIAAFLYSEFSEYNLNLYDKIDLL